jgi:hypothetical protein
MEVSPVNLSSLIESNLILAEQQTERMARIIAMAIVNRKEDPPRELIDFFMSNLTTTELHKIVSLVIKQMDVVNFMKSIILLKGTNILQSTMNPVEQRSQIASGEQSGE